MSQTLIEEGLRRARSELLDLGTRNRLIHTRRSNKFSSSVEIVDELADQVYKHLVVDGKPMTFLPVPGAGDDIESDESREDTYQFLAQPDDEVDAHGVARRHTDDRLQTPLGSKKLQTRLLKLFCDARTFEEEQGVNILFLAIGFLKWFEDDRSNTERFAPLVLVPVKLERQSAGAKFKLSALDEDLSTNLSLAAKLKLEFHINLPELQPGEEAFDKNSFVPSEYFARVRAATIGQPRWQVLDNDMVLWFYSFTKFLMYRDLDPKTWPAEKPLTELENITSVLQGSFRGDPPLFADHEKLDDVLDPARITHVTDADSSQSIVIEEVRGGRHLVVQGPPGTGKSQTITNMIAAAVKDGRKVLFVAEKMAALEVVKGRLDHIGLGQLCLELHSSKANKKAVLKDLELTLESKRPRLGNLKEQLDELRQVRDRLNAHATALHSPFGESGITAYQAMGELIRLSAQQVPPSQFAHDRPLTWTKEQARSKATLVADVAQALDKVGNPTEHPWRGVQASAVLPVDLQRLTTSIASLAPRLDDLLCAARELADLLALPQPQNAREIASLAQLARHLALAPPLDQQAITSTLWNQPEPINALLSQGVKLAEVRSSLAGQVEPHAWTTEIGPARKQIALRGKSWLRWLSRDYRAALRTLESICVDRPPSAQAERIALCDALLAGQQATRALAPASGGQLGQQVFGSLWRGEDSDWSQLQAIARWVAEAKGAGIASNFREILARQSNPQSGAALVKRIAADFKKLLGELQTLFQSLQLDLHVAFGGNDLNALALDNIAQRLRDWQTQPEAVHAWIAYRQRHARLPAEGLSQMADHLHAGHVAPVHAVGQFWMGYYEAVLRAIYQHHPLLAEFSGESHESARAQFQVLDGMRISLARQEVALAHFQSLPDNSGLGEMAIVRREMQKKTRHKPVRVLLREAGHAVQAIKPVFMMSPTSIAQFLEPGVLEFDLLIIDEASQVRPVEAFGAIARCRQIVVVGDDKQMPPTAFFSSMTGGNEEEEADENLPSAADMESILGLCIGANIRQRMLSWHYRSQHHSLIAVSNCEFYNNRLYVIPSPEAKTQERGLVWRYVADGVFDRGGSATNRIEARRVAEAVMHHARTSPELSLGVGAFSVKQRDAILSELEQLRRDNPDCEAFFMSKGTETFFVKNLENLQGDERDVVFISVGYGPNKDGVVSMAFGPLSVDGGERRLNVLISRARLRCEVYSSLRADDIDLARTKARGTAALKRFLKYAETGLLDAGIQGCGDHDSPFEEQVAATIRSLGYEVDAQVGVAGFFIDLAVKDPEQPGRYLLGVECDGATYHSARWARDRDRLRQAVLESRQWTIHRIWSTDWFLNPAEQTRQLAAAIDLAKLPREQLTASTAPMMPTVANDETEDEFAIPQYDDESTNGDNSEQAAPYTEATFASVPARRIDMTRPLYEASRRELAEIAMAIVEIEGPVHCEEVARRIANFWGAQRTTGKMIEAVTQALELAAQQGRLTQRDNFFQVSGRESSLVRSRETVVSSSLRNIEMLPPEEIDAAIAQVVTRHLGASTDEVIVATSRLLGFRTTGSQLRRAIAREIERLVEAGELKLRGQKVFLESVERR